MNDSNEYEDEDYYDAIDIDENVSGDDNDAFIRGNDFSEEEDDYSNEVEVISEGADESNSEGGDEHIEYIRPEIDDDEEIAGNDSNDNNDVDEDDDW